MLQHFLSHTLTDRTLILLLALPASWLFGPPKLYSALQLNLPAALFKRFVQRLDAKLNRSKRSTASRVIRGIVVVGFLVLIAICIGNVLAGWKAHSHSASYLEVLLLAWMLGTRETWDNVARIKAFLKHNKLRDSQSAAQKLGQRDTFYADEASILRESIEYLAENLALRTITLCLCYLIGGFSLALMACMMMAVTDIIGHSSKTHAAFGWAAAALAQCLHMIPARVAALLLVLAAWIAPGCKRGNAVRTLWRERGKTRDRNLGWILSAAAGAVGCALAGPRKLRDVQIPDEWIEGGSAKVSLVELARMQSLYVCVWGLWVLIVATILLYVQS